MCSLLSSHHTHILTIARSTIPPAAEAKPQVRSVTIIVVPSCLVIFSSILTCVGYRVLHHGLSLLLVPLHTATAAHLIFLSARIKRPSRISTRTRRARTSTPASTFCVRFVFLFCVRKDTSVFAASLDALVAVLVQCRKVLPQFFVHCRDRVPFSHRCKFEGQVPQGFGMEFILMRLTKSQWRFVQV